MLISIENKYFRNTEVIIDEITAFFYLRAKVLFIVIFFNKVVKFKKKKLYVQLLIEFMNKIVYFMLNVLYFY